MEGPPPGGRLYPDPPPEHDPEDPPPVPEFLPSAQRALFLRIRHKQREEEERARRLAEGGRPERDPEEGEWGLRELVGLLRGWGGGARCFLGGVWEESEL